MGQYYTPIILSEDGKILKSFNSHNYGNGLKLMEHSYLRNNLVNAVINTMVKEDKPLRLVWAGDYADEEPNGKTLYSLVDDETDVKGADTTFNDSIRFVINETKMEYIDLWKVKSFNGYEIHPLPLLTCEGNGRGGGDYNGFDMDYVGSWARDEIRFKESNNWWEKLEGYTEITPIFVESYNLKQSIVESIDILSKGLKKHNFYNEILKDISECLSRRESNIDLKKLRKKVA